MKPRAPLTFLSPCGCNRRLPVAGCTQFSRAVCRCIPLAAEHSPGRSEQYDRTRSGGDEYRRMCRVLRRSHFAPRWQLGKAECSHTLSRRCGPQITCPGHDTSLMAAARLCRLQVAKTLLAHGAPVNAVGSKGETALMYASHSSKDGQLYGLVWKQELIQTPKCTMVSPLSRWSHPPL